MLTLIGAQDHLTKAAPTSGPESRWSCMLHREADWGLLEKGTMQNPEHSLTFQPRPDSIFPGELHLLQGMGGSKTLIPCSKRILKL